MHSGKYGIIRLTVTHSKFLQFTTKRVELQIQQNRVSWLEIKYVVPAVEIKLSKVLKSQFTLCPE